MKRQFAAVCVCLPQAVLAQQMIGIKADRDRVAVNEPVKLVVEFKEAERVWCGMRVSFGDAEVREVRVDQIPVNLVKTYAAPGTYLVRAEGKTLLRGLMFAVACSGESQELRVVVLDPVAEKQAEDKRREEELKVQALADKERQMFERETELLKRERAIAVADQLQAEQAARAKAAAKATAAKAAAAKAASEAASKALVPPPAATGAAAGSQPKDGARKAF